MKPERVNRTIRQIQRSIEELELDLLSIESLPVDEAKTEEIRASFLESLLRDGTASSYAAKYVPASQRLNDDARRQIIEEIGNILRSEDHAASLLRPPEPQEGPGPKYEVVDGKLSVADSKPSTVQAERQVHLQHLVLKAAAEVSSDLHVSNQHPV